MTRQLAHRASAWVMAVLLTFVVLEPFRVHECPVHLRVMAAAPAAAAGHAPDAAGAAHGAAGAAVDAGAHGGGSHDAPSHVCDCLGSCGLAALAVLRPHPALWVPQAVVAAAGLPEPEAAPAARSADHVLPFANGPPVLG